MHNLLRGPAAITAGTMLLGLAIAPASADAARSDRLAAYVAKAPVAMTRRVVRVHRVRRVVRAAPVVVGPRYPYQDDGSRYDTEYDGIAIGREGDLVPRDGSGPRFARSGASFEIEGPPLSPSLPVVPELVDPSLY